MDSSIDEYNITLENKPEAVLLAAGFSSRAGTFKMTLPIEGKPLLAWTVEAFLSCCSKVYVVGGFCIEELIPILSSYPQVELLENPHYPQGMFSSVLRGVRKVEGDCFICPGDYPAIEERSLRHLLNSSGEVRIPCYGKKKGHPVFLEASVVNALKQLNGPPHDPMTLKEFLQPYDHQLITVEDPGVIRDGDTPHDLKELEDMIRKG